MVGGLEQGSGRDWGGRKKGGDFISWRGKRRFAPLWSLGLGSLPPLGKTEGAEKGPGLGLGVCTRVLVPALPSIHG